MSETQSIGSNINSDFDRIESIFFDRPGEELGPASIVSGGITVDTVETSTPLTGSVKTVACTRIGRPVQRRQESLRVTEDTETGGLKIGSVTLLGDDTTIADFDSNRQGKNVKSLIHFSRMNVPLVSINRENFLDTQGQIKKSANFNNYGFTKFFKTVNPNKRKLIPFEDFPGILNPVDFVKAGNYIMQYMIITDLTRNLDQFINPDDLNGVIEVFEVRESFANTSISDIKIKGIKGSLPNQNFYAHSQGASPIETRFEIDQFSNSRFEDAQDLLYADTSFSAREGYTAVSGSFAFESPVPDENRIMSPFVEASSDRKISFLNRVRDFIGSVYTGSIASERQVPELGTRFRSSNTGFIRSPNYVIIAEDRFVNAGTDSIAFMGMNKS